MHFVEHRLTATKFCNAAKVFCWLQDQFNPEIAAQTLIHSFPQLTQDVAEALIEGIIPVQYDGRDVVFFLPSSSVDPVKYYQHKQ